MVPTTIASSLVMVMSPLCEVAPTAAKFGKQIRYAERRGIPYVWFPGVDEGPDQVKDIRSGDQVVADAAAWQPPEADLHPTIG